MAFGCLSLGPVGACNPLLGAKYADVGCMSNGTVGCAVCMRMLLRAVHFYGMVGCMCVQVKEDIVELYI